MHGDLETFFVVVCVEKCNFVCVWSFDKSERECAGLAHGGHFIHCGAVNGACLLTLMKRSNVGLPFLSNCSLCTCSWKQCQRGAAA